MKKWAVSHINWFNHDLVTVIVSANDWYTALIQHPKLDGIELPSTSIQDAKIEAFNCDSMVEVIEIP